MQKPGTVESRSRSRGRWDHYKPKLARADRPRAPKQHDLRAQSWEGGQTNRISHVHGRCIVSGDGKPGDEGAAVHAFLQRNVGGSNAVVTAAQGNRLVLQGTVDERLLNFVCVCVCVCVCCLHRGEKQYAALGITQQKYQDTKGTVDY